MSRRLSSCLMLYPFTVRSKRRQAPLRSRRGLARRRPLLAVLVGPRCSIPLPHDVPERESTGHQPVVSWQMTPLMLLGVAARRGGLMSSTHRHCMAQTSAAVAALLLASITNTTCCLAMAASSVHAITDSTSRRPAPRKLAAKCSAHSPTAHVVEAWASDVAQDVYRPGYMYSPTSRKIAKGHF